MFQILHWIQYKNWTQYYGHPVFEDSNVDEYLGGGGYTASSLAPACPAGESLLSIYRGEQQQHQAFSYIN